MGTLTGTSTLIQTCRHAGEARTRTSGAWEEAGAPGENSRRHGETIQTLHRQWPWPEIFLLYLFFNQHDKEMMSIITMLFNDPLFMIFMYLKILELALVC